jgi:hypothetical protein
MINKAKKRTPRSPVETLTCEPGNLIEIIDRPAKGARAASARIRPATNGKKSSLAIYDRVRLKDIEVLLNNCVNCAQNMETKHKAKIVRLLSDVRKQVQQLRG